jgi:hypothetical protein
MKKATKKTTRTKPVLRWHDPAFEELREWLEKQRSAPKGIEDDPDFTQVYVDPASNEGPSFESFVGEIRELFGKSVNKGYGPMQPDSPNQLYEFMQQFFSDDHALGEIVYKAIRYKNKRNPEDLVKIAGWAWLVFMHHWRKEAERGN